MLEGGIVDVDSRRLECTDVQLWSQLTLLSNQISQLLDRKLTRRHGLGLTDFMALSALAAKPDRSIRMQELADEIGVNQSTLSRVATRLEQAGLVARRTSEADRRGIHIALTDSGRTSFDESMATFQDELAVAFEMASLSPRTAALVALLRPLDGQPAADGPTQG